MNKHLSAPEFAPPQVTTGPITGSRKIYSQPDAAPELRVPLREIVLAESAGEPPVRVYDTSGIYTDQAVAIDVTTGLERLRDPWVRERGGVESYAGRQVKPEDNGHAGERLAR